MTDAESAIHNLMKSFGSMRKNFNIPSPKSQSPKKEPAPKARRPVLNPNASPHANRLAQPPRFPEISEEDEAGSDALEDERSQSPTPFTRREKPHSTSAPSHPHVLARSSSSPVLHAPIVAIIQVDINESFLKRSKKRISRRQSGLIITSGNSSSGSNSSRGRTTFPPPRAPSPGFGSPLRREAGLAEEEEEHAAIHGQRPVYTDEEATLERASSRGKKKRSLAQAQAEEAPVEVGRQHESAVFAKTSRLPPSDCRISPTGFGTQTSRPPRDTNVFDRQRTTPDTDSDMPSSALT